MGRPPNTEPTTRKVVALPDRIWDRVDEIWHGERLKTQTAAVRRVMEAGLEAIAARSGLKATETNDATDPP